MVLRDPLLDRIKKKVSNCIQGTVACKVDGVTFYLKVVRIDTHFRVTCKGNLSCFAA